MNYFRLLALIARLGVIADGTRDVPKGDAGLYLVCRLFVERLEVRNPGIEKAAGFTEKMTTMPTPQTFADVDTELLA